MFLTSSPSPTISASSSSFHSRSCHASTRRDFQPSSSSPRITHSPQSPRFRTTASAPRRLGGVVSPTLITEERDRPAEDKERTQPERRTVDVGTQYTPPGYPPTYRPAEVAGAPAVPDQRLNPPAIANTGQAQPSAATESGSEQSSEAALRMDHPMHTPKESNAQPPSTTTSLVDSLSRSSVTDAEGQPSPSKKARPQDPAVKVMPLKYETCDVKDLGVLISDMLMELVRLNDKIPLKDGQLTRFHSRAPPAISVRDYLNRLIVHATLSPPILLSMVYYVDRLCALYPAFTISSLTVHRFLITAATVAAKGLSDSFWTNSTYARVGGVTTKELALLELEFLRRLEWRIVPKPEVLVDYYRGLVERGQGYVLEKEEERSNASKERTVAERER